MKNYIAYRNIMLRKEALCTARNAYASVKGEVKDSVYLQLIQWNTSELQEAILLQDIKNGTESKRLQKYLENNTIAPAEGVNLGCNSIDELDAFLDS